MLAGTNPLSLASGVVLTVSNGTGNTATISGKLNGLGGIAKTGAGTLTLSSTNNDYSGPTQISAGTLATQGGGGIGDNSAVTLDSGATLALGASETIGSLAGAGAVTLGSYNFGIGFDNTSTTFDGVIEGSGGVDKRGAGVLTLTGINTFTGSLSVNAGTVALNHSSGAALADTAVVTLAGGTLSLLSATETIGSLWGTSGSTLAIGGNALTVNQSSNAFFFGSLTGTGSFTKTGGGRLELTGSNTMSGAVIVSAGTLVLHNGSAIDNASAVTVNSGAKLELDGPETIGSLAGPGDVGLAMGTLTVGGNNTSTSHSGTIFLTQGLTKVGIGTLTLSGNNTYEGDTSVTAGTLVAASDWALGQRSIGTSTTTVANGATLGFSGGISVAENVNLSSGVLRNISGNNTLSGTVTAGNNYSIGVAGGTTLTLSGRLDTLGWGLTKSDSGTLVLSGNRQLDGREHRRD